MSQYVVSRSFILANEKSLFANSFGGNEEGYYLENYEILDFNANFESTLERASFMGEGWRRDIPTGTRFTLNLEIVASSPVKFVRKNDVMPLLANTESLSVDELLNLIYKKIK